MNSNIYALPVTNNEAVQKLEIYRDIDRQIKALELERDALKKEFAETIFSNSDEYIFNGRLLATYKMQSRTDLDRKALKENMPTIYSQFEIVTTFPVLRIK